MERQLGFLREEFGGKSKLLSQGLIRSTEVNALKRAMADADGQIDRLKAEVAETNAQITKGLEQIEQTKATYQEAILQELQSTQSELDGVREQSLNAENVLRRSVISAPVDGTIIRLHYHSSGGVVESGKSIAEILPTNVPLIIEVQVSRNDIDTVRVGQPAMVRLVALNQRTTPVLLGKVFYVSADALKDGNAAQSREVYLARINLPASELLRVRGFSPTPGMPAEIMIQTSERTFFDYLAKPISDSMTRAFREQ
jgi:HlyD family secretion protein